MTNQIIRLAPNMAAHALRQVERQVTRVALADWWSSADRARLTDIARIVGSLGTKCAGSYTEQERIRRNGGRK